MTTHTSASQRRVVVHAPPSPEQRKACRIRVCHSRQTRIHRDKALKDQGTRGATITNDDNRRSEVTDLKPHKQT
jgi:hypothetical protein